MPAAWKLMGLDGPPPAVQGYIDYGVVWSCEDPAAPEPLREHLALAWELYRRWAIKVYKETRGIRYGKVKD
jgi:hypothetical protein